MPDQRNEMLPGDQPARGEAQTQNKTPARRQIR